MAVFKVTTVQTKPFDGQKLGTSGLRKKVRKGHAKIFQKDIVDVLNAHLGS